MKEKIEKMFDIFNDEINDIFIRHSSSDGINFEYIKRDIEYIAREYLMPQVLKGMMPEKKPMTSLVGEEYGWIKGNNNAVDEYKQKAKELFNVDL